MFKSFRSTRYSDAEGSLHTEITSFSHFLGDFGLGDFTTLATRLCLSKANRVNAPLFSSPPFVHDTCAKRMSLLR